MSIYIAQKEVKIFRNLYNVKKYINYKSVIEEHFKSLLNFFLS